MRKLLFLAFAFVLGISVYFNKTRIERDTHCCSRHTKHQSRRLTPLPIKYGGDTKLTEKNVVQLVYRKLKPTMQLSILHPAMPLSQVKPSRQFASISATRQTRITLRYGYQRVYLMTSAVQTMFKMLTNRL